MKNQSKYCVALAVEYRPQKMEQNKNWENRPNSKVPKKKKKKQEYKSNFVIGKFSKQSKRSSTDRYGYLSIYLYVCVCIYVSNLNYMHIRGKPQSRKNTCSV